MKGDECMRNAQVQRRTRETDITLLLSLDGSGVCDIKTGISFLDHMLTALCVHGGFDCTLYAEGDLQVDCHHTVEDVGICIGQAIANALSDKGGIARYGSFTLPMDESLAFCAVDISGRPYLVFDAAFSHANMGDMETAMVSEFFRALAMHAGITLHLRLLYGENDHHKAEALFKAAGHALHLAVKQRSVGVLSTKGMLDARP